MTGKPNASSNRLSAEGGTGAEAERMKRTRPGAQVASAGAAGGSMASTVMMAGTALIQVIRCAAISAQNPRRLEQREAAVAPVGRRQPVGWVVRSRQQVEEVDDRPAQVGDDDRQAPAPVEAAQPGPLHVGVGVRQHARGDEEEAARHQYIIRGSR